LGLIVVLIEESEVLNRFKAGFYRSCGRSGRGGSMARFMAHGGWPDLRDGFFNELGGRFLAVSQLDRPEPRGAFLIL
jgi:hypothetical protein